AGLPYIVVLTHPTTGGVTASYAMLGDVQIAEPNALICFAGPRVIEQTIREKLPEGFQRAEYLLDHGMLDRVTHRTKLREELIAITRMLLNLPPEIKADLPAPDPAELADTTPAADTAAAPTSPSDAAAGSEIPPRGADTAGEAATETASSPAQEPGARPAGDADGAARAAAQAAAPASGDKDAKAKPKDAPK
ncbi:MAG: hypothetical protein ACU0BR_14700, partial [Brevirhabdus sp.]